MAERIRLATAIEVDDSDRCRRCLGRGWVLRQGRHPPCPSCDGTGKRQIITDPSEHLPSGENTI